MNNKIAFSTFPKLNMYVRFLIAAILLISGILIELEPLKCGYGVFLVLSSSILLMYKNIEAKTPLNNFKVTSDWKEASTEQIQSIVDLDKKISKWSKSSFLGKGCIGKSIITAISILAIGLIFSFDYGLSMIGCDFLALFLPVFIGGQKNATSMTLPVKYADESLKIARMLGPIYPDAKIRFYVLLSSNKKHTKAVPEQVKLRIDFPNSNKSFLGMYGQLCFNKVNSTYYTYFYTTIVFKKDFKLENKVESILTEKAPIIKTLTTNDDVDVLVTRQKTTKTSGYKTDEHTIKLIYTNSVNVLRPLIK